MSQAFWDRCVFFFFLILIKEQMSLIMDGLNFAAAILCSLIFLALHLLPYALCQ